MKLNDNLEVIEEVGLGAYGIVYKCLYDKNQFQKIVAVKKLHSSSLEVQKQGLAEAKLASRLAHPNIVQVFNIDEDFDGNLLIISEYIEGITLREWIERSDRSQEESLYIFEELFNAVVYAHDNGIIHHDISPRNILIDQYGHVKILDFGLSKNDLDQRSASENISGSLSYYDPYIVQKRIAFDKEADIFAVFLILYELLTGAKLFSSSSPLECLEMLSQYEGISELDVENINDENLKFLLVQGLSLARSKRPSLGEVFTFLKEVSKSKPHVISQKLSKRNQFDKIYSQTETKRSKLYSIARSKRKYVVLAVLLLISFSLIVFNKEKPFFYIEINEDIYQVNNIGSTKYKNYKSPQHSFFSKTCDYYYFSFLASIALLAEEEGQENISNLATMKGRLSSLENFFSILDFMASRCPNQLYQTLTLKFKKLKKEIRQSSKSDISKVLVSNKYLELVKIFNVDQKMFSAFDEASELMRNSFYDIKATSGIDIFKGIENADDCFQRSEYIFVHHGMLGRLTDMNYGLLGLEKLSDVSIVGSYNDGLLLSSKNQDSVDTQNFCFFHIEKKLVKNFYGKLDLQLLNE